MFGRGFVENNILANASGQPFVLGDFITHIGNFLSPDIAVWNTFFALIQLFIGIGLLYKGTVRTALAVSFAWVLGIWVIGEGLGMLLTGNASALTGAPGSALLYGLIGLMAWPRPPRRYAIDWSDRPSGVATSAAAQGIGGAITPLAVWAGYWSLAAVLFLLPANRTRTSVQSAISGMSSVVPGWYGHFLNSRRQPLLDHRHPDGVDSGGRVGGDRAGTAGGPPSRVVPRRRCVALAPDVDRRPGPGRQRVQRIGHRPQHRATGDTARGGHGADGGGVEGGLAFARRRGPAAEPGGGRPRHRRPRRGARAQRQLSGRGVGVDE